MVPTFELIDENNSVTVYRNKNNLLLDENLYVKVNSKYEYNKLDYAY